MQTNMVTIEAIKSFDADKLAQWLYKQAMMDDRLYRSLEQLLSNTNDQVAVKAIKSEIAGIRRSRKFLEYGKSFAYARKLDDLLDRISQVQPPIMRLELLEGFILTDESVFARIDDSAGVIQSVYAEAERMWREHAAILDDKHLYKSLMKLRVCDGFGTRNIFGDFIPVAILEKIYQELYQSVKENQSVQFDRFNDVATMKTCAHFLKSPEKYIEAITLDKGTVPDYEIVDVAKEYLYADMPKKTIELLESMHKIPHNTIEDYFSLLIEAYEQFHNEEAITKAYQKWYEKTHKPSILQKYLDRLDTETQQEVRNKALQDAEKMDFVEAMRFFKAMDARELAVCYIFEHTNALKTEYMYAKEFNALVKWLREENSEAAILLYRNAAESSLRSAQSKYYPWAIRHLESMVKIADDAKIEEWTIEPNKSYIKRLAKTHERKIKFQTLLKESISLTTYVPGIR